MMKRILFVCIVVMLCMWTNSLAESQYSTAYEQCTRDANGVTALMRRCVGEEINRLDAELNTLYKKIMRKLDQKSKAENANPDSQYAKELMQANKDLLTVQRAWIKYRDAETSFALNIFSCDGGTLGVVVARMRDT